MQEIFKEIKEKRKAIAKMQNDLQKESEDLFDSFFKKIFEETPELERISWVQYTPYFNDGSACIFSANTDYLDINGDCEDEADWISEKNIISWGKFNPTTKIYEGRIEQDNPKYNKKLSDKVSEIKDFLSLFDDEFYQKKFGDHTRVTLSTNGTLTEEYEHD